MLPTVCGKPGGQTFPGDWRSDSFVPRLKVSCCTIVKLGVCMTQWLENRLNGAYIYLLCEALKNKWRRKVPNSELYASNAGDKEATVSWPLTQGKWHPVPAS